jgi:threonine synthase
VLKELFTDLEFVKSNNICSVNSINWARIAVQCSYYIWAYLQINKDEQFGLPVHFCIPTGAFGNACAGLIAKKMGVPIGRIICATNMNDIVHRTISQGDMSMGSNIQTVSPAMDIQFAYNLERMLYYISNENCNEVKEIMLSVDQQFSYVPGATGAKVKQHIVDKMQEVFYTISVNNKDTLATMKKFKEDHDFLLCPHSAISVFAALTKFALLAAEEPLVCVLTAHPAKVNVYTLP